MRPSIEEYFMRMAWLASTRGTCARRQVGCVLVNHRNQVIATGYNGVARGAPHCNHEAFDGLARSLPHSCPSAASPSGTELGGCLAIHAEQNAVAHCLNPAEIAALYCTTCPCSSCFKLLLATPCALIVFDRPYLESEDWQRYWQQLGRRIVQHELKGASYGGQ